MGSTRPGSRGSVIYGVFNGRGDPDNAGCAAPTISRVAAADSGKGCRFADSVTRRLSAAANPDGSASCRYADDATFDSPKSGVKIRAMAACCASRFGASDVRTLCRSFRRRTDGRWNRVVATADGLWDCADE